MTIVIEPTLFQWTRETYERAGKVGIFEDCQVELIEGQILQTSAMSPLKAVVGGLIADALALAFRPSHHVRSQFPLSLSDLSEPEPDIAVVRGARMDYFHAHPKCAAMVVEISETTVNFDRNRKSRIYAIAGIPEYWIVNLEAQQIEVFRQPQPSGEYLERFVAKRGESLAPLGAPGAKLRVDDMIR